MLGETGNPGDGSGPSEAESGPEVEPGGPPVPDAELAKRLSRLDEARMAALLDELPFDQRELVALVDLIGLSYARAAAIQGVSEDEVRDRLGVARRVLKARLADYLRDRRPHP